MIATILAFSSSYCVLHSGSPGNMLDIFNNLKMSCTCFPGETVHEARQPQVPDGLRSEQRLLHDPRVRQGRVRPQSGATIRVDIRWELCAYGGDKTGSRSCGISTQKGTGTSVFQSVHGGGGSRYLWYQVPFLGVSISGTRSLTGGGPGISATMSLLRVWGRGVGIQWSVSRG